MRREELKLGLKDEGIAPKIHTIPPNGTEFGHVAALNELHGLNTPEMDAFVNLFCQASSGISVMSKILNHVSVFYSLFLRTVTKQEIYIRAVGKSSDQENLNQETVGEGEEDQMSVSLSKLKHLEKEDDVRGLFPLLGMFENSGDETVFLHQLGGQKSHDVSFRDYLDEWEGFVGQYQSHNELDSQDEALSQLRPKGYGEIQAWMFWKYFTGRPLTCNTWNIDLPEIHSEYRKDEIEDINDWGKRVWGEFGGVYTADLEKLNLSHPNKSAACAFPLGCVQNLEKGVAPFSNKLSWEHEHSRPKGWGGVDLLDSQIMCTHHNRLKGENFLFDVHTFAQIITLHRLQ